MPFDVLTREGVRKTVTFNAFEENGKIISVVSEENFTYNLPFIKQTFVDHKIFHWFQTTPMEKLVVDVQSIAESERDSVLSQLPSEARGSTSNLEDQHLDEIGEHYFEDPSKFTQESQQLQPPASTQSSQVSQAAQVFQSPAPPSHESKRHFKKTAP